MLRIRLVGELRLELDGRRLDDIASRRARSLLAWLAYHPGLHPRTRVASVFWPDVLESSARASLRTTLATLRRELGDAAGGTLVAGRERVGHRGRPRALGRRARDRPPVAAGRHADALALGDDDLLTDLDDDWVLEARQAHRERVGRAARGPRRGGRGGRATSRRRVGSRAPPARARPGVRGRRPHADAAARRERRQRGGGGGLRGVPRALQRELGHGAVGRDARAGRAAARRAAGAGRRAAALPAPLALAHGAGTPLVGRGEPLAALRAAWRRREQRAGGGGDWSTARPAAARRGCSSSWRARRAPTAPRVLAGRCTEDGVVAVRAVHRGAAPVRGRRPAQRSPSGCSASSRACCPSWRPTAGRPEGEPQDARHRLFEAVAAAIGHAARAGPGAAGRRGPALGGPGDAADARARDPDGRPGAAARRRLAARRGRRGEPALHALLDDLRRERRLERVDARRPVRGGDRRAGRARGWARPASPELAAAIHRRTGGNPLLRRGAGPPPGRVRPGRPAEALVEAAGAEVPEGVRSVIDRRLARLAGAGRRRRSRLAAVAGEDFALADVAAAGEMSDERARRRPRRGGGRRAGRRVGRRPVTTASPTRWSARRVLAGLTQHAPRAAAPAAGRGARGAARRPPAGRAGAAPPRRPAAGGRAARRRPVALRAAAAGDARRSPTRTPPSCSSAPPRRPRRARSAARRGPAGAGGRPPAPGRRAGRRALPRRGGRGWRARSGDDELLARAALGRGGPDRDRRPGSGRRAGAARGGPGGRRPRTPSCGRGCSRGWRSRSTTRRRRRCASA